MEDAEAEQALQVLGESVPLVFVEKTNRKGSWSFEAKARLGRYVCFFVAYDGITGWSPVFVKTQEPSDPQRRRESFRGWTSPLLPFAQEWCQQFEDDYRRKWNDFAPHEVEPAALATRNGDGQKWGFCQFWGYHDSH